MRHAAVLVAAVPLALAVTCPKGAYVIVARASDEPAGFGIIGAVKDQLLQLVSGSSAEAVDYPASFDNYVQSESEGVTAMRGDLTTFVDGCPNTPVVLMGYSQGAQVTADTLVGQDDSSFPDTPPLSNPVAQKYADAVKCVILMGDPSFNTSETSIHVGNASMNGFFPRKNFAEFATLGLTDKTQSYCDFNDTYCASGSSILVHVGYVQEYGTTAAKYCADKLGGSTNSTSGGNGTSTGGSNATSTYSTSSPSATGGSSSGSGGSSASGSAGAGSASGTGSGSSPSSTGMATSSGAVGAADLRAWGIVVGALVAGFFTLV